MSIDPWGGGSDQDPKLRLRELGQYKQPGAGKTEQKSRRVYSRQKPAVSVLDALLMLIGLGLILGVLASIR
jgi:hypothetical protein